MRRAREHLTELLEVVFVLAGLVALGVLASPWWAVLAGGVLGVVACERVSSRGAVRSATVEPRSERVA